MKMSNLPGGDPVDAALTRASVKRKLFDIEEQVTVGRFVVERRLGSGGMGVVFQAKDPELGRTVALKLLHPTGDETKLLAEARALARLRHPNVVAVHDVGSWQGRVFITMEHVPGGTLRAWLHARARTWREILAVMVCAGRGLAAAHRAEMVHRDVKPDNVLVGDGDVRVADFGLAQPHATPAASDGNPGLGTATLAAGTPRYMAPEVREGAAADARADQYSFCVTLYEALYGVRPKAGVAPPASPRVPARARRAIARGLALDPAGRHPSMEALLAELERDAGRTARRVALVAVTAAAAAAVVWGLAARRAEDRCGGGASQLAEVWNDGRRETLRHAFAGSRAPYAAATGAAAIGALDRYAAAWIRGHRDSCEATHVRRDQSPATLDLRTRCLERRRAALAATVDLLAGGEGDAVERAPAIVGALPSIDACADVQALAAPVPPPDDAAARERLVRLEGRLAELEALTAALRLDAARELGTALVAEARGLDYRPFLAETLVAFGTVQGRSRDKAVGETLREALAVAQASGHDAVVASTAIKLCMLYSRRQAEKAHDWANLAAATLERLGRPPALTAPHEAAFGVLLASQKKEADAIPHLEAAVAASEQAGQAGTLAHAGYLQDLGNVLETVGRREEAIRLTEQALAIYRRLVGDTHPLVADALNNLGIAEERIGRVESALGRYDEAYAAMVALSRHEDLEAARIIENRAFALRKLGRLEESLAAALRANAIKEKELKPNDPRLAGSYTSVGIALSQVNRYAEALAYYERALPIQLTALGDKDRETAETLWLRGTAKLELGRAAEGLADCETALATLTAAGEDDDSLVGPLSCIGRVHIAKGRRGAALAALERAMAIANRDESDPWWSGQVAKHLERARAMPAR